jgi:protein-arginine kinase activator protein McsA
MSCDACGSGDSLFVVVSGNSQGETRLCKVCAREKGYLSDEGQTALPQLDSILDQLEKPVETEACCPECGMGLEDLVESGRLGCPGCVQVFKRQFLLARKRRGLGTGYAGRIPKRLTTGTASLETPLESSLDGAEPATAGQASFQSPESLMGSRLLADMESAVFAEDFEKAAKLRDCLGSIRINGKARNDT